MYNCIIIAGPTASGKTKISVELAKRLNGEIVNADSMQVYKELNIGTAKITEEEKEGIPHHLFDVADKFERAGFHAIKSEFVNAPIISELPMSVECELLKFNEDGICIGKIVNVSADESILDKDGMIDATALDPIIYDSVTHAYRRFGEKVGVAFSDGLKIK